MPGGGGKGGFGGHRRGRGGGDFYNPTIFWSLIGRFVTWCEPGLPLNGIGYLSQAWGLVKNGYMGIINSIYGGIGGLYRTNDANPTVLMFEGSSKHVVQV